MPQQVPLTNDNNRRGSQLASLEANKEVVASSSSSSSSAAAAAAAAAVAAVESGLDNNGVNQQQQQQVINEQDFDETINANKTSERTSNVKSNLITNSIKTTKLNGLKNRIIQRPPPLILDKVSNFYDNKTQSSISTSQPCGNQTTNKLQQVASNSLSTSNLTKLSETNPSITSQQQQVNLNQNNSTANHKFWASLNLNAQSRTRNGLGNRNATSMTLPRQQQDRVIEHSSKSNNNSGVTELGADLIITHRNTNSTAVGATGLLTTSQKTSNSSAKQQQQQLQHQPLMTKATAYDDDERVSRELLLKDEANDYNKPNDMSNNSEFDDSSTHGGAASETDGGNLIGVDNPTPPASTGATSDSQRAASEEPPVSATSSRPRSNNPFLATDEELLSNLENETNFHKRPASFIAATDSKSLMPDRQQQHQQISSTNFNRLHGAQQQVTQRQYTDSKDHNSSLNYDNQNQVHYINGGSETIVVNQQQRSTPYDQNDSSMYGKSPIITQQQLQSIYGSYCQNANYINYEPTISLDSESAVRKPPPSAIMQVPHWTEAIYELHNAILETNSIAGGAENGQFIYIVKSGDIILELDRIKVSGFTLIEFNQLVESKSTHLLNAVQTKHSHSLTIDLKHYLNCSFAKDSSDKELQDLIRENIYRRTIPCTTRPPKKGEVDKVDYHFLTREQFVEMNNRGMLLECGTYGNHYYGTMKPFSDLNSLSIYGTVNQKEVSVDMRQPLNPGHPAIGSSICKEASIDNMRVGEHPLYENQESLRMNQTQNMNAINPKVAYNIEENKHTIPPSIIPNKFNAKLSHSAAPGIDHQPSNPMALDTEALPHGWERVNDQTHGIYYIDHNTQQTQYERPYEIELTKGAMGFGFTLVEADSGVLLVRSVIPGGPAQLNGTIRPGDILLSAVGVSVSGLQHTDIARLFSTFAVGDRIRLTFARSAYVVDANLVPDEYLFSNGTNGDLTVAVNSSSYHNHFNQGVPNHDPSYQMIVDDDFVYITVALVRGDQGFGFTISETIAGQTVRKIQNKETCTNLKQGDILISLNGVDIVGLTHKEVVERLKNFPIGEKVSVTVKRRKTKFRSRTPMSMHTSCNEYSMNSAPQRNCKTPSLDGLMLRRSSNTRSFTHASNNNARALFNPIISSEPSQTNSLPQPSNGLDGVAINMEHPESQHFPGAYSTLLPADESRQYDIAQPIYGANTMTNNELYYNQQLTQPHQLYDMSLPTNSQVNHYDGQRLNGLRTPSISNSDGLAGHDNMTSSAIPSETSLPPIKFANHGGLSQINQYNNFMNNDKLVMMQMQQQRYQQMMQPPVSSIYQQQNPNFHHMPVYSNSDILETEAPVMQVQTNDQIFPHNSSIYDNNLPSNYYANNEEIVLQQVQYGYLNGSALDEYHNNPATFIQQSSTNLAPQVNSHEEQDPHEYHQVDLDRGNKESNWGIRLIGGSEVNRAISIGSIVFGGAAHKNGRLKSGDEIISINNINVVGETHQHVVELISACQNRASLVVRRKKFGEACEVVLNRNLDEGFGFVIISSGNCALIGRIIEGSPADRCQQLHVKDRIIAVNGRYITPNMQHPEIVNMIKECGSTLRLIIIPADCYTVELIKSAQNDNFGFSMRGGSEYDGTPLYILRVAPNGLAKDLLNVGDQIIEINSISTVGMTHKQAATIIKHSDPIVKLKLRRNHVTPPSLLVDSPRALQKYNQVTAEMKTVNPNVTPNYLNDGLATSEHRLSLVDELQQQPTINDMVYNQSMPLYVT